MWFKGSLYTRVYRYTHMYMCNAFSERLKLVDFKINKTVPKNLNEEEPRQSENEEFEAIKRVILHLV